MKDITRIHIAKVPYSIELSAKKELETYISALEAYTADAELLQDIEIRITELLLERGVKQEDVIASADVAAIREQLGEPKEFMTDEATADVDAEILSKDGSRKLYRNLDSAAIGGVLSGIASYIRVNVVWVRLAFIVVFFLSAGLVTVLYILAWLIIPPAKTAAEKLQMTGRPVTLSSIRELNESGAGIDTERRAAIIKRVLTTTLGIGAILTALGAATAMVAVGIQLAHGDAGDQLNDYQIPVILMFVSGVLLLALSLLVAIAAFTQKFNKRIWISAIVIIALGLGAFGSAITLGLLQQRSEYEAIERNTVEVVEKLPASFASVKTLSVDMAGYKNLNYVVDASAPHIEQRMLKDSPKAKVVVENGVAKITVEQPKVQLYGYQAALINESVTVYGPAVDNITVTNGYVSYDADSQATLRVEAKNNSMVSLAESRIDALDVTLDGRVQFTAIEASVSAVSLALSGTPDVSLGNIKTLTAKGPEACAAHTNARVAVQNILSATYEYNGLQTASKTMADPCFKLSIGSEEMRIYDYQD